MSADSHPIVFCTRGTHKVMNNRCFLSSHPILAPSGESAEVKRAGRGSLQSGLGHVLVDPTEFALCRPDVGS